MSKPNMWAPKHTHTHNKRKLNNWCGRLGWLNGQDLASIPVSTNLIPTAGTSSSSFPFSLLFSSNLLLLSFLFISFLPSFFFSFFIFLSLSFNKE